jgi:hypothetical protein
MGDLCLLVSFERVEKEDTRHWTRLIQMLVFPTKIRVLENLSRIDYNA